MQSITIGGLLEVLNETGSDDTNAVPVLYKLTEATQATVVFP